ncbi:MAG: endonuclease [Candidatus Jettenia sp.]|uniref:site-specific DNA-methyltransferase (adenine-specific) n=1 Tax=Candidatus Jettenia caeni TaxID=247490 RepID=I3ILY6_9BACT|nr:N-6 DNA methylase [Candidatus Jettenia sp. AMX1]MBC6928136.1 endonuclease [Candidatus Jettenia sp.]NUN23297.1 Eco57I restriction-modification methylase domain-containing protein [Candidatus Jettenia caeni]KAA0249454.1 MAG: endonuclease [Candidatus Jettenia sp. AMX1]MCE7879228.1 endonuclease [Candidatus Jettenia sp. AMX1]MCQ3925955.1 endonuclease [Candidatus Jettenia sp.]
MSYTVTKNKAKALEQLTSLITSFEKQYSHLKKNKYSEAQLRIDFLNAFLKTFGWDVNNEEAKNQFIRDVIQEESINIEEDDTITKKNPDYTLRILGNRKLFVEAKKVSIDIEYSKAAAFQTRRYGWNANLGISILTNFEKLIVYDCRYKPNIDDGPQSARYRIFHFKNYLEQFEELYQLLSYNSVSSGFLDEYFSFTEKDTTPFDEYFLLQIEKWREKLAINVLKNNKSLKEEEINFLIQRLINRIIFLRICEDREIEKYETLKKISNYEELKKLFIASDKKYNSGLFDFIEDNLSLGIIVDPELLIEIFNELYYPASPYDFSVIEPNILNQIYEKYLGSRIALVSEKSIRIVKEPEVIASNGVIPTPKFIVDQIIRETLEPLLERSTLQRINNLKIVDICCGSGTFLISLFDYLIEKHINILLQSDVIDNDIAYQTYDKSWRLTLKAKQKILLQNIFGVDVNPYAIEVTRFSLLLKLLENEKATSIDYYLNTYKRKVLPNLNNNIKCGNSLIDDQYFEFDKAALENDELLYKLKPFNWSVEFPFLKEKKGFDAVIGNPPYVRIQNLVKYSFEEIQYYQSKQSPYSVASSNNFDKYYLFIERAIELTNENGVIGYIVPHKFFIVKGAKKLRALITSQCSLSKIVHFGVTQVFPGRSTYTAILVIDKRPKQKFSFKRITKLNVEHSFNSATIAEYNVADYSDQPWIFLSNEATELFKKIKSKLTVPLKQIAEISVGLQTSADRIYVIQPIEEKQYTIFFEKEGKKWEIEKAILLPCIYDLSFSLFDIPQPNALIIFPYTISNNRAEVFSEKLLKSNYPLCWKYLNHYKTDLEERSINGTREIKWYQYGRSQSLTKFHNNPKIIWPVLSKQSSYAYDNANLQFTGGGNGPYYSLISNSNYSIFYLLAILAHPAFEAMVKARASEFRGSYYSHGKQFIENLPIRNINFDSIEEVNLYNSICKNTKEIIKTKQTINKTYIANKKSILQRKFNYLYNEIISMINSLYGIKKEELEAIKDSNLFLAEIIEDEQNS